jgi:hypothetical protein
VASGSWTRSTDYNTTAKAEHGLIVFVQGGTVNGNKFFKVDQSKPTIGTTPLTFTEVFGATGDGNGIYSGSGNIATAAVATVASGSTFTIDYNGGADAILVSDSGSSTTIKSKNGSNAALVDNASVTLSAGSNSATLTSTGYDVVTNVGGPQLSLNATEALIFKGSQQLLVRAGDSSLGTGTYYYQADSTNSKLYLKASTSELDINATRSLAKAPYHALQGHNSTTQAELRLYEQSSAGNNYTAIKAQNQSADITYTLPAVAPASDGHVLSATTAGVMSWIANGSGGDGNGIYSGSGTIASAAVAKLTASSTFTIDWSDNTNALHFIDTTGTFLLNDKTANNGVYGTATTSELYSVEAYMRLSSSGGGTDTNVPLNILLGHLSMNSVISPSQITANQNNYAPADLQTANVVRLNSDASRNITGLSTASATKVAGWVLTLHNVGSFDIVLKNEDAASTAAYRFALGADVTIGAGRSHTLIYDSTSSRWRSFASDTTGAGGGITSLNGLTAATQTFATGTSGTDFNIDSTTSTHTFHIPDASASNRGLVTTGTQTFAGNKTFNGTVSIGSTTPTVQSNSALTTATTYTIGNSSSTLNVGGSSGIVNITSSAASGVAITVDTSTAVGASTRFGTGTYSATSGTISSFLVGNGFAPTSGTGVYNALSFVNSLNQSGGASGITRLLYLNPTLTAIADLRALEFTASYTASSGTGATTGLRISPTYNLTSTQSGTQRGVHIVPTLTALVSAGQFRGIDVETSNANMIGVYQSGALTTNNFVGRTSFGTTSAPHASAAIDVVTTSTGVGLPVMTSTQRDAISSPRQGLMIYNTTDDKVSVRRASDWVDVAPDRATINAQTGTTYTLVLGDAGKTVTMDNASPMTLTIPANGTVAFPVGTTIDVVRKGAGTLTIAITTDTLRSASSYVKLASQYSGATLLKIATTEWILFGNLSA